MEESLERFKDGHYYSYITEEFPDRKQFPNFYDAKRIEIILEPGDMLELPAGWYHLVLSEEPDPETGLNVAVNFWYKTDNWDVTHFDRKYPIKTTHTIHTMIDYFKFLKTMNDRKLLCSSSESGCFTLPRVRWIHDDTIKCTDHYLTFNEFYEKRNSDEHWYMWSAPDTRLAPYKPLLYEGATLEKASWWVNFGNVHTTLHCDGYDNLLCQISGRKRIILFPHSEWSKLHLINPYHPEFIQKVLTTLDP